MTPFICHRRIDAIHLHHSAGSELDTPDTVARYAVDRGIGITHDPYNWHVWRQADLPGQADGVNRWTVSPGRDPDEVPASAKGHNASALAVCVHGDYSRGPLPVWAFEALVDLVAWLCRSLGLTADDVHGHRELGAEATLCPGYDPEVVRTAVRARL